MIRLILVRGAGGVAAAVLALSGCSGENSQVPTLLAPAARAVSATGARLTAAHSHARPAQPTLVRKGSALGLYAVPSGTSAGPSTVSLYLPNDPRNAGPTCYVGQGNPSVLVGAITVDDRGRLWVPAGNEVGGTITEFGPRCGANGRPATILKTLNDPDGQADGVAIDSKDVVYVNNIISSGVSGFGPGNVAVYTAGATSPTTVLNPISPQADVTGVALDGGDNLYISYNFGGPSGIEEFAGGTNPGKQLNLSGLSLPIGIAFDAKQNLLVVDTSLSQLLIYAPPYSGSPKNTITLHSPGFGGYGFASLNAKNTLVYVSNQSVGAVEVYQYPSGKYLYSITNGLYKSSGSQLEGVTGVALDPASPT